MNYKTAATITGTKIIELGLIFLKNIPNLTNAEMSPKEQQDLEEGVKQLESFMEAPELNATYSIPDMFIWRD
jgi:hypothetical protein